MNVSTTLILSIAILLCSCSSKEKELKKQLQGKWHFTKAEYSGISQNGAPNHLTVNANTLEFTADTLLIKKQSGLYLEGETVFTLFNDTLKFTLRDSVYAYQFFNSPRGSHIIDCGFRLDFLSDSVLKAYRQGCYEIIEATFDISGDTLVYNVGSFTYHVGISFDSDLLILQWKEDGRDCKQVFQKMPELEVIFDPFQRRGQHKHSIGISPSCFNNSKWKKTRTYQIENDFLKPKNNPDFPEQIDLSGNSKSYKWDEYILSYDNNAYTMRLYDYTGTELHFISATKMPNGSFMDISNNVIVYRKIYD